MELTYYKMTDTDSSTSTTAAATVDDNVKYTTKITETDQTTKAKDLAGSRKKSTTDAQDTTAAATTTTTTTGPKDLKQRRSFPPRNHHPNKSHFRLLCHVSTAGGIIGKSGSIVKSFEQSTNAKIRVDDAVDGSDVRLINISSDPTPKQWITLRTPNGDDNYEVSFAQLAIFRVFERILEIEREMERDLGKIRSATCRLLAEKEFIPKLMGKEGKRIKQITVKTGARVRVLNGDHLPPCALPNDELIQISGDIFAVKKAVLAITQCFQDFVLLDNEQMIGNRPFAAASGSFSNPSQELPHNQSSWLPPTQSSILNNSMEYAWRGPTVPPDFMVSKLDSKKTKQGVQFKLISTNDSIGCLIGKGGLVVKSLENETGASIKVRPPVAESDDRVILVSALENLESRFSPAQNAVVRVFTRCTKAVTGKGLEPGLSVTARLMVTSDQVGCLIGKGGSIVSEMRRATGTSIWVLTGEKLPKCGSANDYVVEIAGRFANVQDALFNVTGRLRNNVMDKLLEVAGEGELSFNDQKATLTDRMDRFGLSNSLDHSPPRLWAPRTVNEGMPRGDAYPGRGRLERASESNSTIVTNTTLKVAVSGHIMGSIYGENEKNLTRLREISGAVIVVHEPHPGTSEGSVIISGTPDQTQVAQSLLQAFIRSSGR